VSMLRVRSSERPHELPTVTIEGVAFAATTSDGLVAHLVGERCDDRGGWLVTMNVDIMLRHRRDPTYASLLQGATVIVADGMPIVWASRLAGCPLPERISGADLVVDLAEAMGSVGRTVFLLGGAPGVAGRAAHALRDVAPSAVVAGSMELPMGFEAVTADVDRVAAAVAAAMPDVVLVALGAPKQDWLIARIRGAVPGAWFIGVGISLGFLVGDVPRAPIWMRAIGLEWLHRLWSEPLRLGRRYLWDDLPFAVGLLARSAVLGLRGNRRHDT
jgi:N-acetylglucosaminyldiphosphoundecaprenol N-acetyl-beta-D-mannosaminyltransferase